MEMSYPPTAELIAAVQGADSSQGLLLATQALAACADPAAASTLVEVLGFNNPGAAVAAVDGLIGLGPGAVDALLQLDPENYGARAWAVRALAGIGDVRGLELLVDALGTDVAASVRRAAAKGLGALRLGISSQPAKRRSRPAASTHSWPPPPMANGWCAMRWWWDWKDSPRHRPSIQQPMAP